MGRAALFIGAGILFLIGLCLLGYGALNILGASSTTYNNSSMSVGISSSLIGAFFLICGAVLTWFGLRKTETVNQNVVMNLDLPGETKINQMKCQSCGGVLSAADVKMMAGAPVVTCPYCGATYQLTEEPKW